MKIQIFDSINEIGQNSWQNISPKDFPFASFHYLNAFEISHCVGSDSGWQPVYLTCWNSDRLEGAIILYRKTNSYGEYIFDFAWAQAYQSHGVAYYPKLLSAIPFTPATGSKILINPLADCTKTRNLLLEAVETLAAKMNVSSVHGLFIEKSECDSFETASYSIRHSYQFHWHNQNYINFDDFLSRLNQKRRKEISRERRQVQIPNLKISLLTGLELKVNHAQTMYNFYLDTTQKMGGISYLNLEFFEYIFKNMSNQILFVYAEESDGTPVAGALNYFSPHHLYGRNWGCLKDYKSLHFELCYYRTIEFAIEKKLKLFEAGAQGEHKFQRGFLPSKTFSAHKIFDSRFKKAISHFIEDEKSQIASLFDEYGAHNPYQ